MRTAISIVAAWVLGSALILAGTAIDSGKAQLNPPNDGASWSELKVKASKRDLVITQEPTNPKCPLLPTNIDCAGAVYFNGDWKGVRLCKGKQCVEFEEIFK